MSKDKEDLVTVHLIKPHRHAGREYQPGTEEDPTALTLPKRKAEWLVGVKTAKWPNASTGSQSNKPAEASTSAPAASIKPKE